ncbi:hypothetical protein C8N35_10455 [Breoghania corrubedonensis]|uniref:Uncharacterized protein n=1 Tax=Breoghania corrubedonensis TaxID=665038 RepID=A0A2T5V9K1_9HYPH|nr:hypothetical protein C8N35_10455 [Breoghania corrubedonensis]
MRPKSAGLVCLAGARLIRHDGTNSGNGTGKPCDKSDEQAKTNEHDRTLKAITNGILASLAPHACDLNHPRAAGQMLRPDGVYCVNDDLAQRRILIRTDWS